MFLGEGDLHDPSYNDVVQEIPFFSSSTAAGENMAQICDYSVKIYPSRAFDSYYDSNISTIAVVTVGAIFVIVALIFLVYDNLVNARNRKITAAAERSIAVVSSIFPKNVRDRVMAASDDEAKYSATKRQTSNFSSEALFDDEAGVKPSKAIADLFLEATVMLADIAGA